MRTPPSRLALCLLVASAGWIGVAAPAFAADGAATLTDEQKALLDYIRSGPQAGPAAVTAPASQGADSQTQAPVQPDLILRRPQTAISCLGGGPRDNCAPKNDYYSLQSFFGAAKTAPGTAFDGSKPAQGAAPAPAESNPDPAANVQEPSSAPVPPPGAESSGGEEADQNAPRAQLPESLRRKSGAPPSPEAGAAAANLTVSNKKDEGKKGGKGGIGGVFETIGGAIKTAFTWVVNAAKSVGGWVAGLFKK